MGYYVETGTTHNKAQIIAENNDGTFVTESEARELVKTGEKDIIVVVDNGPFEAAAFAFDMKEFEVFTQPNDSRPRQFISLTKGTGAFISGY